MVRDGERVARLTEQDIVAHETPHLLARVHVLELLEHELDGYVVRAWDIGVGHPRVRRRRVQVVLDKVG